MWAWLKNLLGFTQDDNRIKSYEEETSEIHGDYRNLGIQSVEVDKIVGSVGRAHELDRKFRYRNRAATERYHQVAARMQQGRPMEPIKVIKVKRDRANTEFYVVDGHHRVSEAKLHGHRDINAQVIELIIPSGDAEKT